MTSLIVFALIVLGVSYIVTVSAIGMPVRVALGRVFPLGRILFYCPYCISFWIGLAVAFWFPVLHDVIPARLLFGALAGVGVSLFNRLIPAFQTLSSYEDEAPLFEEVSNGTKEEGN